MEEDGGSLEGNDLTEGAGDGMEELVPGEARDDGIGDLEQGAVALCGPG
jgi:hypothetical protein